MGHPAEPDDRAVHVCSGCGCLIGNIDVHATVCVSQPGDPAGFGQQIAEWLDTIDVDQLDKDIAANSSFDDRVTVAALEQLKRYAVTGWT